MNCTIRDMRAALKEGSVTSAEIFKKSAAAFEADKKSAAPLNAFLEIYEDAPTKAEAADAEIASARSSGTLDALFSEKPLLGLPFANKDNIAITHKKIAPGNMSRFNIRCRYSSVLSVRTPGMEPPFSLMFFAISVGFSVT